MAWSCRLELARRRAEAAKPGAEIDGTETGLGDGAPASTLYAAANEAERILI
jgi:hypothetical protein